MEHSKTTPVNLSKIGYLISWLISWLFGIAVFIVGVMNVLRGNDPGLGLSFMFLSLFYLPPVYRFIQTKLGFSVHYLIKLVVAIAIIWITLAVGAIAEGYYPGLFAR